MMRSAQMESDERLRASSKELPAGTTEARACTRTGKRGLVGPALARRPGSGREAVRVPSSIGVVLWAGRARSPTRGPWVCCPPHFIERSPPHWCHSVGARGPWGRQVRLVSIGNIDTNPCCGTHLRSTAQMQARSATANGQCAWRALVRAATNRTADAHHRLFQRSLPRSAPAVRRPKAAVAARAGHACAPSDMGAPCTGFGGRP